MPRVNVYIHTTNTELWENLPNKSAWVNEMLERVMGVQTIPPYIIKAPKEAVMSIPVKAKPCKHGSDPRFCKFSKPGKLCK